MNELSYVAGILDLKGGLRVVVTRRKGDFERHHRQVGERVLVVPGFMVREPVPWNKIPLVISRTTRHVHEWIRQQNEPSTAINNYLARLMNPDQPK